VVFFFFLAEGLMMWAFADAQVNYSPLQKEVITGIKPPKKMVQKVEEKVPPPPLEVADSYLVVPKLFINAPVEPVGVTPTGEMATPESLQRVAWWKDGIKPGQVGSAVFAGHYGSPGEAGIFRTLDKLVVGDVVEVRNKSGQTMKYKVYKSERYKVADVPLQELFNKKDGKYLNLVTCVGAWDAASSSYSDRLIIYTKLVE
jgi:LPXTG-site transpeptidase (sortase) family protein